LAISAQPLCDYCPITVDFGILGPLEVAHEGRSLSVGGARTRAVLAMLMIAANRVVSSDRMIEALWPAREQERGAANLQVRLSELRRALRSVGEGERLVTRAPGYLLRVDDDELDVLRFERLAVAGRKALLGGDPATAVALLSQGLALWRGPALSDLDELEFVRDERARLEESRLAVLEARIEAQLGCGRHRETVAELARLSTEHPLRERFWFLRLVALYRSGRQSDALGAYRDVRTILVEQLGIEPGAELRELHARILRQDPGLDAASAASATPKTRYAVSGDVHIAFQVVGEGERDIVFVPGAMSHLDLLWEDSETTDFFRRLAGFGRLILFDKRDTGLSDRAPAESPLEERMDDVRAVMSNAGSSRAALFGYSEGAAMSILFAATYPDRVGALILGAATARYRRAPDYPCGEGSDAMFASLEEIATHRWGQGASIDWFLPSRAGSSHARELFARFERMSISPSAFLRIVRMIHEIDVRALLPVIHVPTLVIQRLDDRMTPPCHGRYLADHIPGARYFEQPGDHSLRFASGGDIDRLLGEIEDFLSGVASGPARDPDRVLATVLSVRPGVPATESVRAHRGRVVRAGEGGLVAVFDAPGAAIRCAVAICAGASASAGAGVAPGGIHSRAGIHTGEIELRGEDVAGASVRIASRLAELAEPGEILVSRTVTELVIGTGIEFSARGTHDLIAGAERWPLFAVARV
jgi:DNA-binding SARP family transcriptional activator/pimeloyl-ACP methyl ester carboxylesterase